MATIISGAALAIDHGLRLKEGLSTFIPLSTDLLPSRSADASGVMPLWPTADSAASCGKM